MGEVIEFKINPGNKTVTGVQSQVSFRIPTRRSGGYDIKILIEVRPYYSSLSKPIAIKCLLRFEVYSDQCSSYVFWSY